MSELEKILLTSGLTIIGGVFIFVIGQLLSKFLIEPIYEQRKIIRAIADDLLFYAMLYEAGDSSAWEKETGSDPFLRKRIAAEEKMELHISNLMVNTYAIPFYKLWEALGLVRSKADINKAGRGLSILSTSIVSGNQALNMKARDNIAEALDFIELFPNRPKKNPPKDST